MGSSDLIGKGEKPKLESKWWIKARPKDLGKTDLEKALKGYEQHLARGDANQKLKDLKGITKAATLTFKKCDQKKHPNTKAALVKLRTLSLKEVNKIVSESVSAKPQKQKIGKPVVIWRRDIGAEVKKVYKSKFLKEFKGYVVELRLNDDILDVLEKEQDFATPHIMVDDAQKACALTVKKVVKFLTVLDVLSEEYASSNKLLADCKKEVEKEIKDLAKRVEKIPQKRWATFTARKKQYKLYKVKCGSKIVLSGSSLVLSFVGVGSGVGGLFLPGAQGLAISNLVVSIIGMLRSLSSAIELTTKLGKKAESVQKALLKDLKTLHKRYEKEKLVGAREIVGTTANTLISDTIPFLPALTPTISACEKDYKLWSNKVAHLAVSGRSLSKQFTVLLRTIDKLQKKTAKVEGKEAAKLQKKIKKLWANTAKAFDKAGKANARVIKADQVLPKVNLLIQALKKKNPAYAKVFDFLFPKVVDGLISGTGAGLGYGGANGALDIVNTSITLADDIGLMIAEEMSEHV